MNTNFNLPQKLNALQNGTAEPLIGSLPTIRLALSMFSLALMCACYGSVGPAVVLSVSGLIGGLLVRSIVHSRFVIEAYDVMFFTSVCVAGVASVYAQCLSDPGQLASDAAGFFELSTTNMQAAATSEEIGSHEGPLAITSWRWWYLFWSQAGIAPERYVGIALNCVIVSMCAATSAALGMLVRPESTEAARQLRFWIANCGLLWLAAGIHIRDGFVLLTSLLLIFAWVHVICDPRSLRAWLTLVATNYAWFALADELRRGLSQLGLGLIAIYCAITLWRVIRGWLPRKSGVVVALMACLLSAMPMLSTEFDTIESVAIHRKAYDDLRADTTPSSSAATSLLKSPVPLVRFGWGIVHLFLFPVPAWTYLRNQPDSAYFLFKTASIPYMWLLLPGVVACALGWQQSRSTHPFALAFILLAALLLFAAVCMTSIESRHALPAIVLLTIASCAGGETGGQAKRQLRVLRSIVLSAVVCLHFIWLFASL